VDVLEPPQHLVEEKLVVVRREVIVGFDHLPVGARGSLTPYVNHFHLIFEHYFRLRGGRCRIMKQPAHHFWVGGR
jgi:hypothetical protein